MRARRGSSAGPSCRLRVWRGCSRHSRVGTGARVRRCRYFSGPFKDELTKDLKHTGAGILSMVSTALVLHVRSPCAAEATGGLTPACLCLCCHCRCRVRLQANAGPNTNRSQFFVTLAPTPWLDGACAAAPSRPHGLLLSHWWPRVYVYGPLVGVPLPSPGKHTIFGRVCSGMTVIKKLGLVPTDSGDKCVLLLRVLRARLYGCVPHVCAATAGVRVQARATCQDHPCHPHPIAARGRLGWGAVGLADRKTNINVAKSARTAL